ncbi:MAG: methyltransferase domain-containing protein [Rhodobacterales bacterium]|nr:methyltransferase domain-containing protein [Rhodobacterales bacterium]
MTTQALAQAATPALDPAKMDAFADTMIGMLNAGALALMTSVGHRTGLFDTMAQMPPATSAEIAARAGLNERYVREWLGAMATGGLVDHAHADQTYHLCGEHAAFLTRAATPDNIAAFAQYMAVMGGVEDRIVDCFHNGGGVSYGCYHRFHEVMAEDSGQTVLASLLEHILPLAPGLTARLEAGIQVMDIGCGSGRALNLMARAFPKSWFTGYDLCEETIAAGRAEADRLGLKNIQFLQRDTSDLDEPATYDLITAFDAIHDQARPDVVLAAIARALKPGGVFLMQDIGLSSHVHRNMDHPIAPLIYTISTMHCTSVSLAQGGAGLGAAWGRELAQDMLAAAGFGDVTVHDLPHDFQNCYYVARVSA